MTDNKDARQESEPQFQQVVIEGSKPNTAGASEYVETLNIATSPSPNAKEKGGTPDEFPVNGDVTKDKSAPAVPQQVAFANEDQQKEQTDNTHVRPGSEMTGASMAANQLDP